MTAFYLPVVAMLPRYAALRPAGEGVACRFYALVH